MAKLFFDKRKIGSVALIVAEVLVVAFLLVVSIATMATVGTIAAGTPGFRGLLYWLQTNTVWFFVLIVFPLIVIFLANVYLLIKTLYADKQKKAGAALTKDEMLEEAKRQARAEVLKELEDKKAKDGTK